MLESLLPFIAVACWTLAIAGMVIFVSAVVRISHSFEQISRALVEIAEAIRRRNS